MYYDFNNIVHRQHLKELERNANLRFGQDPTEANCSWRTERELEAAKTRATSTALTRKIQVTWSNLNVALLGIKRPHV
jgi:hypothetical protein